MTLGLSGDVFFSVVLIVAVSGGNGIVDAKLESGAEVERQVVIQFSRGGGELAPRSFLAVGLIVSFLKCSCSLSLDSCKCCLNLKFVLEKSCCISLQYDRGDVLGGVSIGDVTVLDFHVTGTSFEEPPSCFNLTLPMAVGVCIQFYKTKWDREMKTLHACSGLELMVMKTSVYKGRFGCLELGEGGVRRVQSSEERKPVKEVVRVDLKTSGSKNGSGHLGLRAGGVRHVDGSKERKPEREVVSGDRKSRWKQQNCFLAMERGQSSKHCT